MENQLQARPPAWFWIVAGLGLAWNLLGVVVFVMQMTLTPQALAELSEAERQLMQATPMWVNIVYAVAVFGGALGCLALLIRKSWAVSLLVISLLAVLLQMCYALLMSDSLEVYGNQAFVMPIIVIVIAIFLVWFATMAKGKGWIR